MMNFEEAVKLMSREELEVLLLDIWKTYGDFENYLRKELGEETFIFISKEFALEKAKIDLKEKFGMSDEDVKEFEEMMSKEKVIN